MKMHASAQVIPLPGAAAAPVVQVPRIGRRPKCVVSLRRWESDRRVDEMRAQYDAESLALIASEIESLRVSEEIDARIRAARAHRLHRLTAQANTPQEKKELAEILADIRWYRLPYEVRQRIEAQREGRGAVVQFPESKP
jgi:hypothetical protein